MKVRVSDLSARGFKLSEKLPEAALNERLHENSGTDVTAIAPIEVAASIQPIAELSSQLKGSARVKIRQHCGRCNLPQTRELTTSIELILKPTPAQGARPGEYEDDVGIVYFKGDYINLAEIVHEALILALDLFWKPELDQTGKCSACGVAPEKAPLVDAPSYNPFSALGAQLKKK